MSISKRAPWQRKEITTKGADPTVVVTWAKGDIEIQEFQGEVLARVCGVLADEGSYMDSVCKDLFLALEGSFQQKVHSVMNDYADRGIYGGR